MEFWLSKLVWPIAAPSHLLVLGLVLVSVLPFQTGIKVFFGNLILCLLLVCLMLPVGDWALLPLEACIPKDPRPMQIDGAVTLGGAIDMTSTLGQETAQFNGSAGRFLGMLEVMKLYPLATIVYTGGSGSLKYQNFHEADYIKFAVEKLGLDSRRIQLENTSKNTLENAQFTKPIYGRNQGQAWLLITSAYHMPRALALFKHEALTSHTFFYPYPTDFKTPGRFRFEFTFDLPGNLAKLDMAAKEYVGMLYNHLKDNTIPFMACDDVFLKNKIEPTEKPSEKNDNEIR